MTQRGPAEEAGARPGARSRVQKSETKMAGMEELFIEMNVTGTLPLDKLPIFFLKPQTRVFIS